MFDPKETLEELRQRWREHKRKRARRPEFLRKWYTWQRVDGNRVQICYVPARRDAQELQRIEVRRIVEGCDETLLQIAALLNIKLTRRRVTVFLYPDDHAFRRCEQIQGQTLFRAITRNGSISLPYGTWNSIAKSMAHELTHIVCGCYVGRMPNLLLNEGLAKYVENKLYPATNEPFVSCLSLPLGRLANCELMANYLASHSMTHAAYAHARAFAWYMIDRYGMNAFLRLLKASASRNGARSNTRFTSAVQKMYGLTVEDLEQQWRRAVAVHSSEPPPTKF